MDMDVDVDMDMDMMYCCAVHRCTARVSRVRRSGEPSAAAVRTTDCGLFCLPYLVLEVGTLR